MPIYEYECMDCGHRFELNRKINERDSPAKCPKCGAQHMKRAFGSFISTHYKDKDFKSQVEKDKPSKKVYLGYGTKPSRWGHSKPVRPTERD